MRLTEISGTSSARRKPRRRPPHTEQPPARRSGDEGILLEEEGEIELSSLRGSLALSLSGGAHASPLSARAT